MRLSRKKLLWTPGRSLSWCSLPPPLLRTCLQDLLKAALQLLWLFRCFYASLILFCRLDLLFNLDFIFLLWTYWVIADPAYWLKTILLARALWTVPMSVRSRPASCEGVLCSWLTLLFRSASSYCLLWQIVQLGDWNKDTSLKTVPKKQSWGPHWGVFWLFAKTFISKLTLSPAR